MKATETPILRFLQGPKQFVVPIFQRRYSWEQKQCQKLWDDVLKAGKNNEIKWHFLGSIVYMEPEEEQHTISVPRHQVIDGQQRLTTLSLLLLALSRAINEQNGIDITPKQLLNYYLFNDGEEGELRYKQLLTKGDKATLIYLLESKVPLPTDPSPFLVNNYRFFEQKIKNSDLKTIYIGLSKLMVVDIVLNREGANPQLIFESLNSTGIRLSEADLIRNYMFLGQDITFQNKLYKDYWFPMEQSFRYKKKEEYLKRINSFMRDFLTLKTKQIPNRNSVYVKFKEFFPEHLIMNPENASRIAADISRYATHYVNFTINEEDLELLECLEDMWAMGSEVVYPFLLEVYDYYKYHGYIEKIDVIKTLRLIESYVFRRAICGLSGKFLNHIFVDILREVSKDTENNYLKSLNECFLKQSTNRRFPTDTEFKEALLTKDIYNLDRGHKRCRYMLRRLENYENKEPLMVEKLTIEHVMPQKLTKAWQEELGENYREIHSYFLHTIGNLTLTGYNSEYSNRPFKEKCDMSNGFEDSGLNLNKSLVHSQQWNRAAIINRARELAEKACNVWIYPEGDKNLSYQIDDQFIRETYNTDSAPQKLCVIMENGEIIDYHNTQDTFVKIIIELNPEEVMYEFPQFVSTTPFANRRYRQHGEYYININHGVDAKKKILERIADALGVSMDIKIVEK